MGNTPKITDEAQVDQALQDDRLIPPGHANSLDAGTTAELRNAMARFSSGSHHTSRRADVEAAIAAVNLAALNKRTLAVTSEHLAMREDCDVIGDIGFVVPTEALAMALGVPSATLAEIRRDVRSIVACIGRGEPSSKVSDDASTRLLARFESHPGGAVATVSMLYQNHDATASMFAATLLADARNEPRRNALARTVRVATADVHIGEVSVAAGETVEVRQGPRVWRRSTQLSGCRNGRDDRRGNDVHPAELRMAGRPVTGDVCSGRAGIVIASAPGAIPAVLGRYGAPSLRRSVAPGDGRTACTVAELSLVYGPA